MGSVPPGSKYVWYDADTLIYLAAIRACKLDVPIEAVDVLISNMYARFESDLRDAFGDDITVIHCLSPSRTFRHEICDTYKANRIGKWKPPLLSYCIEVYETLFPCIRWDNHEADDICSILHHQIPGHILCSGDKDLQQCPGTLFNPRTKVTSNITPESALFHRMYQWMVGDSADGYGGAYLIGDAKATKLLQKWFDNEPPDVVQCVENILEVYETQNIKAEDKGKDSRDPTQQFYMSQMLIERFTDVESLPNPVSFLQAVQNQRQNIALPL